MKMAIAATQDLKSDAVKDRSMHMSTFAFSQRSEKLQRRCKRAEEHGWETVREPR
ncbi:hypothetical protein GS397_12205 [Sphingobium yanoikuyae]|jgi:hypothetical protein|uniref:Uncharacterized protein n=1 Tax=Sphingobium yanoikuyae TaxID=13690 RepID=A0A6P1GGT8_SPHYA|nr:hypothetical protein [Sphingobium yanoikuyae]QHD67726.1 hypothetical protein GS397_12205 [Sphingobium yanoikuyae]